MSQKPGLGALGKSWARPVPKTMVTAAVSKSTRVNKGIESETKPEAKAGSQQDLEKEPRDGRERLPCCWEVTSDWRPGAFPSCLPLTHLESSVCQLLPSRFLRSESVMQCGPGCVKGRFWVGKALVPR